MTIGTKDVAESPYGNALSVERNGINVIAEDERKGKPADLFWPWFASNISVLGLSYAAFVLFFGLSFWQAIFASLVGTVVSFLLVGFVSFAGKRGSSPTMALSRAAFGVRGNALPTFVSYLLLVGWEIVLVSLGTLATATIFGQLGWSSGNLTKVIAFLVVVACIVVSGVLGFDLIMRLQKWLTYGTIVITLAYIALTAHRIDWNTVQAMPGGSASAVVGALILMMTAFGLSWVNSAADYSRYLPRSASGVGVVGWTTFGGFIAPVILLVYGLLLIGSDSKLIDGIASDPLGTLATLLPDYFLVIYAIVVLAGLIAGAVLDIYSSGLALLTLGVPLPRWAAALFDGVLMIIGSIYVVWFAKNFIDPFEGFLITLGVPITSWCGIFLADLLLRRRDYDEVSLFDPRGRYGAVNLASVALMLVSMVVGWGLVVSFNKGFGWEGYLLGPVGFSGPQGPKSSVWAGANLGVAFAFALSFLGYLLLCRGRVRRQEAGQTEGDRRVPVGSR
jgi:nucleobase:cation symporter-1, NCS1 family